MNFICYFSLHCIRFAGLASAVSDPNTLLMWPGPSAVDMRNFVEAKFQAGFSDVPHNLVVLDGTWHQARSIYAQNTFLHTLKQVHNFTLTMIIVFIENFPKAF